jgi:TRAP-type C4-dicarboxylate transport system substrate-binding protein
MGNMLSLKRWTALCSWFVMALCLLLTANEAQAKKPIEFRFGFVTSPKVGGGVAGVLAEQYINAACAGEIEAKFFPNALMGTDPEMIDKTRMGVLQGVIAPLAVLGNTIPYTDTLTLPFVINTWDKAEQFIQSPVSREYMKGVEPHGFKSLGFCTFGLYGLECNSEARTLEEIRKLKFRVAEAPILLKTFESMGVKPMVIPFPDLYESLKQGVVDGCDLPPNVAVIVKYTEVIKYFIKSGHSFGWYLFLVNKNWHEKLPAPVQAKFDAAVDRACREHWAAERQAEAKAFETFRQTGITTIELAPAETEKFLAATKGVIDWRLGQYPENGRRLAEEVFKTVGYQR